MLTVSRKPTACPQVCCFCNQSLIKGDVRVTSLGDESPVRHYHWHPGCIIMAVNKATHGLELSKEKEKEEL